MPERRIPNTVDVHFRYSVDGNRCENVYQMAFTVAPTPATMLALVTEIANAFLPRYQAFQTISHVYHEVLARNISPGSNLQAVYTFPPNTVGSLPAAGVALSEAARLILKTLNYGRRFKGAKGLSGFHEGYVNGNTISNNLVPLLANLGAQMLLSRVGGLYIPAVASFLNQAAYTLSSVLMNDNSVDSQKTRLNNRGA